MLRLDSSQSVGVRDEEQAIIARYGKEAQRKLTRDISVAARDYLRISRAATDTTGASLKNLEFSGRGWLL